MRRYGFLAVLLAATIIAPADDAVGASAPASPNWLTNAAHSNAHPSAALELPLKRAWRKTFEGSVSYPLIGNGRVFVTSDWKLYALDLRTGQTLWSRDDALARDPGALSGDKLVTATADANQDLVLTAYAVATGRTVWKKTYAPPTVPSVSTTYLPPVIGWLVALRLSGFTKLLENRTPATPTSTPAPTAAEA